MVSVPFGRNSRQAKPAPISHRSDRWRTASAGLTQIVTEPSPDRCQSHSAETPDQQNLPRSRTVRIGGGSITQDWLDRGQPAARTWSSFDELSEEKCENCEMMKTKGSSDLKPEISDQSHLAKTRGKQNLPRSRTARIGGGPLLPDSNTS